MSYQEAMYTERKEGIQQGIQQGRQEGIQEGRQQERRETIEKLRKAGMGEEQIKAIFDSEKTLAN